MLAGMDHESDSRSAGSYWKENLRRSLTVWEGKEKVIALLLYVVCVAVSFGYFGSAEGALNITLAFVLVVWLPVIVLVITPRKMWTEAQNKIAEYEDRFKPRLEIKLDERSVVHKIHNQADSHSPSYESWVRLQIANDSDEALSGVSVTIEDCTPKVELPIPFELSDAYCEQPPSLIPARDRRYVELVRSAGNSLHLRMYASPDVSIPRNEYVFKVRASTASYPCRNEKAIKVSVDDDGKLSCQFIA